MPVEPSMAPETSHLLRVPTSPHIHSRRFFICSCVRRAVTADIGTLEPEIPPTLTRIHHGFQLPEQGGAARAALIDTPKR